MNNILLEVSMAKKLKYVECISRIIFFYFSKVTISNIKVFEKFFS